MGNRISFTVYGEPKAKARPRVFSKKGKVWAVNPSASDEKEFLLQAVKNRPEKPLENPLRIKIKAIFSVPKSFSIKKREKAFERKILPTKRPDIDNIIKFVVDSLQGIFFKDDSQIVECEVVKEYGEVPRTEVEIEEITEEG